MSTSVFKVFKAMCDAIDNHALIERESKRDKEFHFQNWVQQALESTGDNFDVPGRNAYPDFTMVNYPEGYEVKGLAYPGRYTTFDANSQAPVPMHNGRTVFYVFGRYPSKPDGDEYPVLDLVVCHGELLNADSEYVHKNRSVRCFGTYGDILIRDRKMYVPPTPYALLDGIAHGITLVLPQRLDSPNGWKNVGNIERIEADEILVGYSFDLQTNEIEAKKIANPKAGTPHLFSAWRTPGGRNDPVSLREGGGTSHAVESE